MGLLVRGLRVAGGVALVALGTAVAAARIRGFVHPASTPQTAVSGEVAPAAGGAGHAIPDTAPSPPVESAAPAAIVTAAPALPPPTPLPIAASPAGVPALDVAYRSALALPPPPLLDLAPPGGSTAPGPGPTAVWGGPGAPPRPAAVSTDHVRDGDDLTTIAVRVYGHPAAAGAILEANRDRISDPSLLPVGVPLRLPPVWSPLGAGGPDAAVISPARRPALVIVGAGETFESLARRFYGNADQAGLLFEANRDRVRSPALLTAGTELRLP